jgi:hypothetical protein
MKGGGDEGAILGVIGVGSIVLIFIIIVFHMTGGPSNYRYVRRSSSYNDERRDRRDVQRIRRLRRLRRELLEDGDY